MFFYKTVTFVEPVRSVYLFVGMFVRSVYFEKTVADIKLFSLVNSPGEKWLDRKIQKIDKQGKTKKVEN